MNALCRRIVAVAVLLVPTFGGVAAQESWDSPALGAAPGGVAGFAVAFDTVSDPIGDTFGVLVPQLDITSFSAFSDGATLTLGLTFAGTISRPGSGAPDELFGFFDLDTDQNPGTGAGAATDSLCPSPSGLGADFYVAIEGVVLDSSFSAVAAVPITVTSNTYSVQIPLAVLGGDDGIVNTATVIGTLPEPTDCAPNGGFITSSLPAVPTLPVWMATLLLLALLLAGAIALRRRTAALVGRA